VSLRALIEAKNRRKAKLPLLVGDLAAASNEVATLRAALQIQLQQRGAKTRATKAEDKTRADLKDALERQAACVVEIELQALPADEWEAIFGPIEPDENGDLDISEIHAVALAASCTDSELQDAEWWAEQLTKPHWTRGDRAAITQVLMELNTTALVGTPGKD
jgi:hypothetical protein